MDVGFDAECKAWGSDTSRHVCVGLHRRATSHRQNRYGGNPGPPGNDPTSTDGILDRLVHNAHCIEMDSMRKNPGEV
jgi:hypothetical protein